MLPGVAGHLLSSAFIDHQLPAILASGETDRLQRDLSAWRCSCAMLGPASTSRSILQTAAPLFAALGFDPAERIEICGPAIAATLRSGAHTVAVLVPPWGEARDPLWRLAVAQAAQRTADWCLLFDGLQFCGCILINAFEHENR